MVSKVFVEISFWVVVQKRSLMLFKSELIGFSSRAHVA